MTQKSVSIRANVSIRGVTIRAYALYIKGRLLEAPRAFISVRYLFFRFSSIEVYIRVKSIL